MPSSTRRFTWPGGWLGQMGAEARVALRNTGFVVAQQIAQVVSGLLFAVLVVRAMGPEMYGRYAVLTALLVWFFLLSGLGFNQAIGRYVPGFVLARDRVGLTGFLGSALGVRLLSAAVAAGLYLALTMSWLRDLDRLALALMTGVLFLRSISQMFYALFLGLNQAARWGMGQVIREWVTLALIIPGVHLLGLRGAGLALLVTEIVVLMTVLAWARPHLRGLRLSLNVSTYLRFGLLFFASDALWAAFQYSGEPLVRALLSNYAQVGYFGLAYNIYLTAVAAIAQLAHSLLAQLTTLLAQGQTLMLQEWIERLLKWLAIGGVLVVLGTLFLGEEAVALVFGAAYRPVAVNLIPLALALFALALGSTAQMLAAVYEKPEAALQASGVRLAAFWALGIPLIAWQGSLGGCIAVLVATAAHAAYFTWRMRRAALPYSLRQWVLATGLGLVLLPLAWLRSSWLVNTVLYGVAVFGYSGLLWLLRVVTPREAVAMWQAVWPRGRAISPIG